MAPLLSYINKHQLVFTDDSKSSDIEFGHLYTCSDYNATNRKPPAPIFVLKSSHMMKWSELVKQDKSSMMSFLLASPPNKDSNKQIAKFIAYLREKEQRAAYIFIDSKGTKGILQAADDDDKVKMDCDGFRCYIVSDVTVTSNNNNVIVPNNNSIDSDNNRTKRKHDEMTKDDNENYEQSIATDHYDNLKRDQSTRHHSQIYHLRNLNNWVKTNFINKSVEMLFSRKKSRPIKVLDVCCGMGGDLLKWFKIQTGLEKYVGVDIAMNSVKELVQRCHGQRDYKKVSKVICGDMGSQSLVQSELSVHTWEDSYNPKGTWKKAIPLTESDKFDIASCQFAIHYMFQSEKKAEHFFSEISRHLAPNGLLIASTMDCRVISKLVTDALCGMSPTCIDPLEREQTMAASGTALDKDGTLHITLKNALNNPVLKMSFKESMWQRLLCSSSDNNDDVYGIQYNFVLLDNNNSSAVEAPEFIVPLGDHLINLARKHKLILKQYLNCNDLVLNGMQNPQTRMQMIERKVFNWEGKIDPITWQLNNLYMTLVFERMGDEEVSIPRSPDMPPPNDEVSIPRSPDMPPPNEEISIPRSPDMPPPNEEISIPRSPDMPPPNDDAHAEEEDESMKRMLLLRQRAVDFIGGEDEWDALDEDERDKILEEVDF